MKTFKKVLILCLLVVLSVTLLVACGEDPAPVSKKFTVTFVQDDNTTNPVVYTNGQRILKPTDPVKEGYKFVDWYEDEQYENRFSFGTYVSSDLTLYAKWVPVESYTVTLRYYEKADSTSEIFTFGIDEKLYTESEISSENIQGKLKEFKEKEDNINLFVNKDFAPDFIVEQSHLADKNLPKLEISKSADIKVRDIIKYADDKGNIKINVYLVTKYDYVTFNLRNINLLTFRSTMQIVDGLRKGVVDFSYSYMEDANLNKIMLDDKYFYVENGVRVMPNYNYFIEEGNNFNYWLVELKDGTFKYYNEKGNEIDKLTKEEINPTTNKYIKLDYQDIKKTSMVTDRQDCEIQFFYKDANGNNVRIQQNGRDYSHIVKYGDKINVNDRSIFITLDKFKDSSEFFNDKGDIESWNYVESYGIDEITAGQKVSVEIIKYPVVKVVATLKPIEKEVVFVTNSKGDIEQYFNRKQDNQGYYRIKLEILEQCLKANNNEVPAPTGLDAFNSIIGGMYEVIQTLNIPIVSTADDTSRNSLKELELNKQQSVLVGFKVVGEKDLLIIVKEIGGKKVLVFNPEGEGKFDFSNGNTVQLYPVFNKVNTNAVKVKVNDKKEVVGLLDDGEGNIVPDEIVVGYTSPWTTNFETGYKLSVDFAAATPVKTGYKFVKWVVVSTPYANDIYNGVTFDASYNVLGETIIQPVFTIDTHTVKFVDEKGNSVLPEGVIIEGNVNEGITEEEIKTINEVTKDFKFADEEKVFDYWYTTIGGDEVKLNDYLTKGCIDQDVTFNAKFNFTKYDIRYYFVDIEASKKANDLVVSKDDFYVSLQTFNCQGIVKGKELFDYQEEYLKYTDETGAVKSYIKRWYYIDSNNKKVTFNERTKVKKDMTTNSTLYVYPELIEFDVSFNANGGVFSVRQENGTFNNQGKVTGIKVNAFGIKKEYLDKIDNLTYFGYKLVINDNIILDVTQNLTEFLKTVPFKFTKNIEIVANWKIDSYKIDVIYQGMDVPTSAEIDKLIEEQNKLDQNLPKSIDWKNYKKVFFGTVTGTYNSVSQRDGTLVVDLASKVNIEKLITDSENGYAKILLDEIARGKKPREKYGYKVYEIVTTAEGKVKVDISQIDFSKIIGEHTLYVEVTYEYPAIILDANGGLYKNTGITNNREYIESHIVDQSVLSVNGSAYLSKMEDNEPYYNDQGAPQRKGYIFAGFATLCVGDPIPGGIGNVTIKYLFQNCNIYYGYQNNKDIDETIFNSITNKYWLGAEDFVSNADNYKPDGSKETLVESADSVITYDIDEATGNIINLKMKKLYAIWVPINIGVDYYKLYQENGVDVKATAQSDIKLSPNDRIINPMDSAYHSLVGWAETPAGTSVVGSLISDKVDYSDLINNMATKLAFDQENMVFNTTEVGNYKLYETLAEGIVQKATVTIKQPEGKEAQPQAPVKYYNFYDTFEAVDGYTTDFNLVLEKYPSDYTDASLSNMFTGFAVRETLTVNGKPVDIAETKERRYIKAFAQNVNGEMMMHEGKPIYVVNITAEHGEERYPIALNIMYRDKQDGVTRLHHFNETFKNILYNEDTMSEIVQDVDKETGDLLFDDNKNPIMKTVYNRYKANTIRVVVENDKYKVQRRVWRGVKYDGEKWALPSDILNPYFNDFTKNLTIGNNVKFTFDGTNCMFRKHNGVTSVICEGTVNADWADIGNAKVGEKELTFNELSLTVNYVDATGNPVNVGSAESVKTFDKYLVSGNVNPSAKYVINPTLTVYKQEPKEPPLRKTWTINGKVVDNDALQDGNITNQILFTDLTNSVLISGFTENKDGATYSINVSVNAVETWVKHYEIAK